MKDIAIIGGGPAGIYAAFYAGLRGLDGYLIEASEKIGGQPRTLYGQKYIYDIPGFVKITGEELAQKLEEQYEQFKDKVELMLNSPVQKVNRIEGGFDIVLEGKTIQAKTILISVGNGMANPIPLDCKGADTVDVIYAIKDIEDLYGKKVLIFGGGDSAVDWANMLEGKAEITLVHRRDEFRAKADSVEKLRTHATVLTNYTPIEVKPGLATIKHEDGSTKDVEFDEIVVMFGLSTGLGQIGKWNCDFENGKFLVNTCQRTTCQGIWAIGNANTYRGKNHLITSGFGEAIDAITSIHQHLNPGTSGVFLSSVNKK